MKEIFCLFISAAMFLVLAVLLNALVYGTVITATMFLVDFICGTTYFSWQYVAMITLGIVVLKLIFGGHKHD